MDLLTAENQLAAYVANKVSLTLDQRVFSGVLPDSLPEGIEVSITECCAKDADHFASASARAAFYFSDRTELENYLHSLLSALPEWGCSGFHTIELGSHLDLSIQRRREIPVYCVVVPLHLIFA